MKRITWLLTFFSIQFCTVLSAQSLTLTGKVIDRKDNSPIIGASVIIKNSNLIAISNKDGLFSIKCVLPATLVVSYIGHKSKEVSVSNANFISIQLESETPNKTTAPPLVFTSTENVSTEDNKPSSETENEFSKIKYRLPENKFREFDGYKSLHEFFKVKYSSVDIGYHTTSFTNYNFANSIQSGMLKSSAGVDLSLKVNSLSPVLIEFAGFIDTWETKQTTLLQYGTRVSLLAILIPSPKFFIPFGGVGYQISKLTIKDSDKSSDTSSPIWKVGVKSYLSKYFCIYGEYTQTLLDSPKSANQICIGIGF